jgi:uncharacterized protein YecT (DUF1311 family)
MSGRAISRVILAGLWLAISMKSASYAASSCDAETQAEMNQCAGNSLKEAEREMQAVYDEVRAKLAADSKFAVKLAAAQKAWEVLRDAELAAKYPHEDEVGYYGSVFPMCFIVEKERLVRERIEHLRLWLAPRQEGDVCADTR